MPANKPPFDGEWVRLNQLCMKGRSALRQKDLIDDGPYAVYGASGIIGSMSTFQNGARYVAVVKDGAGVGRANLCSARTSVLGTMQALIPTEMVLPEYLLHLIRAMRLGDGFSGSTIPHIYFKDYGQRLVRYVSMADQERIVGMLGSIEDQIDILHRQNERLDTLVKSRFVEMFGDPATNSHDLPIERLSDLGVLERGKSKHRPRNAPELRGGPDGPYPLVQTGDIANAGLYLNTYNDTYTELGLRQSKMWPKGTLCITIAANIAQTTILAIDACFPDSVVGFTSGRTIQNVFLHYWFSFFQSILEEQAPRAAQKNINLRILSDLGVITPSIERQQEFASFVAEVDKSRFNLLKAYGSIIALFRVLFP